MTLDIAGLGIIAYSPSSASHIREGDDYLESDFWAPEDVQRHVQSGSIVPFATSSPGLYILTTRSGYPSHERLRDAEFRLRLGLRSDGIVVFRDLYDFGDWTSDYPAEQAIALPAGIYHMTLCSDLPPSGVLGDNQQIDVFFQPLAAFPDLAREGIPTLSS